MIYEVINFLRAQLEELLLDGKKAGEPLINLSSPWSNTEQNQKSSFQNSISLINIEEERIFKSQEMTRRVSDDRNKKSYEWREPDIKLNLYLLISSYHRNYNDSLKVISKIAGFFQRKNVFRRAENGRVINEGMPDNCEKIIVELFSTGFEQQNQIWASLSTGYLPSLVYRVRMLVIDTMPPSDARQIEEIEFTLKDKKQLL
jgi:hypothetical protein